MTEGIACECVPECVPGRKLVDGLEFEVSTWCDTPQSWNSGGSWLVDPDSERIKAAIREVSDLDALEVLLEGADFSRESSNHCQTFWGGHGCNLREGHDGVWHVCGPLGDECMAVAHWGESSLLAWNIDGPRDEWSPWGLHWEWYS